MPRLHCRAKARAVALLVLVSPLALDGCAGPEAPAASGGTVASQRSSTAAPPDGSTAGSPPLAAAQAARVVGGVAPRPTAVAAALRARRFEELEALFSRLADDEAADPERGEIPAQLAAAGLDSADPELEPILVEWHAGALASPIPDLALAHHYDARAWLARGGAYAVDTPRAAFDEMAAWQAKALQHARAAVEKRSDLVDGWRVLIHVAQGEPKQCIRLAEEGLAVAPASYRIRAALMICLLPRWGGRYELMARVATEGARHVGRNRRLGELAGFMALDRADLARAAKEYEDAGRWLAEAAESAVDGFRLPRERARLLDAQGRATEGLAEIDRALERWPDYPDLLERRVGLLSDLGRDAEALAVIDTLAIIDPASATVARWRTHLAKGARKRCESLTREELYLSAVDSCREAIAADPSDAHVRSWLGYALLRLERWDEAKAELHAAVEANPRQRDAILNLDWLYARTKEWAPILELWDAYLELEPGDARAWLERAGTHSHLRQWVECCRDMTRACELGSQDACAEVPRACARR